MEVGWIYVTLELVRMSPIILLVFHSDSFELRLHMLQKTDFRNERWLSANIPCV
jgi:hypothetical protein